MAARQLISESFDHIIVGSGSAGCVVANRLSADPKRSVLLLEAGGRDWSPVIKMPAATDLYGIGNPRYDWRYLTEPDPTRKNRRDLWPRGKVLGGSSSINAMVYMRGQASDYDSWAALGNSGWAFRDVLPYFIRMERNEGGASEYRGAEGPLRVSNLRVEHPLSKIFIEAAHRFGVPLNADFAGATIEGVGPVQATQFRGWRHSAADAYLRPIRSRRNLSVRVRSLVNRIRFVGKRATGVDYLRNDGSLASITAKRSVILSAGAVATPQLLMLSGVGPAETLKHHGIEVRQHLPGVGQNLQDHVGVYLNYRVDQPTYNSQQSPVWRLRHAVEWLVFGRGPGTTPGALAMAFVRSDPDTRDPDLQLHFTPIGYKLTPEALIVLDEPVVTAIPNVNRPLSRGELTIGGSDIRQRPVIKPRLLENPHDIEVLRRGGRMLRAIFDTSPLSHHVVGEIVPGPQVQSDEEWEDYLRSDSVTIFHPCGTCKMGVDEQAVVDPRLRVHGFESLSIVDASVMPHLVSGNINAPVIMIGERGADFLLEQYP
jgi:choline dehydrogenase